MLEVLDTAGQEEYTALRDQWIRDGEGFVLVYSITSRASFTRIHKFYNQIQLVKESANAGSPTGSSYLGGPIAGSLLGSSGPVPVMLVGNKSDKAVERTVSAQEGSALAKELGCEFVEASAKNCINVEKAFYDVVRLLRQQRQQQQYGARVQERRATGFGANPRDRDLTTEYQRPFRPERRSGSRGIRCTIL
jgi:GTPase KRas